MSGLNQFFKTTDPSSATDLNKYMYLRGVDEHSPYVSEEGNPAADAGLPVITPLIDLAKIRSALDASSILKPEISEIFAVKSANTSSKISVSN